MLWLEVLAASLFVFAMTHSGWNVAVVSAARAAPLLLFGAVTGVLSDAVDRRLVMAGGLALSVVSAGIIAGLSVADLVRPWHLASAAFVSGSAYATEFPARRRMVAESAGPALIDSAIAADSLTSYAARCFGPLLGGLAFQTLGLTGAFSVSCGCNLLALVLALGASRTAPLRAAEAASSFLEDLGAAATLVRSSPVLVGLLAVTVTMNLCGYSYSTLMTPIGVMALGLDDMRTGVLAAAEPAGALLGGFLLLRVMPRGSRLGWMMRGVAILAVGLLAAAALGAAGARLPTICMALAAGGFGSAVYTNMQTSLVMAETPDAMRSRIMGLLTVCIGSWPLGMLLAGALANGLPPLGALAALACCALLLVSLAALLIRSMQHR